MYLSSLELPSGERVAARINGNAVKREGGSIYSGENSFAGWTSCEGRFGKFRDLLSQIEHRDKLSRKDFYIDMVGDAAIQSEESFIEEAPAVLIQLATV